MIKSALYLLIPCMVLIRATTIISEPATSKESTTAHTTNFTKTTSVTTTRSDISESTSPPTMTSTANSTRSESDITENATTAHTTNFTEATPVATTRSDISESASPNVTYSTPTITSTANSTGGKSEIKETGTTVHTTHFTEATPVATTRSDISESTLPNVTYSSFPAASMTNSTGGESEIKQENKISSSYTNIMNISAATSAPSDILDYTSSGATKQTSVQNDETEKQGDDVLALKIGMGVLAFVIFLLVLLITVYFCFQRRQFQNIDIEVANLKKKLPGNEENDENCTAYKEPKASDDDHCKLSGGSQKATKEKQNNIEEADLGKAELPSNVAAIEISSKPNQHLRNKKHSVRQDRSSKFPILPNINPKKSITKKHVNLGADAEKERILNFHRDLSRRLRKLLKSSSGKRNSKTIKSKPAKVSTRNRKGTLKSISRGNPANSSKCAKGLKCEERKRASVSRFKRRISSKNTKVEKAVEIDMNNSADENIKNKKEDLEGEFRLVDKFINECNSYSGEIAKSIQRKQGQNQDRVYNKYDMTSITGNGPIISQNSKLISNAVISHVCCGSAEPAKVQSEKTELSMYERTPKRKRYLKLYRLMSSALGYSWSYKEVMKKTKKLKLDTEQTDFCPDELRAEFVQEKCLVSEKENEQCFEKSIGTDEGNTCKSKTPEQDSDQKEKSSAKTIKRKKRGLKQKRIFPQTIPGLSTINEKSKIAKHRQVKSCHWTASKF